MKSVQKKIMWSSGVLIIAVTLFFWWDAILLGVVGGTSLILAGIPSEQDESDAQEIYQTIASRHHFDRSLAALPGRAPVFSTPGSHALITVPIRVHIYFVTSKDAQDELIKVIEDVRKARNTKPIKVMFFTDENWTSFGPVIESPVGPVRSGSRGPEKPIREVLIK